MKTLILAVSKMPEVGVEAEAVKPDSIAGKTIKEVEDLTVHAGKQELRLGDVFEVRGEIAKNPEEQRIIIENSNTKLKRIGESMTAGEVTVKGDAGYHLGEYMKEGRIVVEGNAPSWIGTGMKGGEIIIKGSAGSHIGASARGLNEGMTGGSITIHGNAGTEIGVGMMGGDITVNGSATAFAGSYMKGGKIRLGSILERVGYAMTSGEIKVEDKLFKAPFYFKKIGEEEGFLAYEGDASFGGKGVLKIRR